MGALLYCETYQDKMSVNVVPLLVGIETMCQIKKYNTDNTHACNSFKGAGFVTRIQTYCVAYYALLC